MSRTYEYYRQELSPDELYDLEMQKLREEEEQRRDEKPSTEQDLFRQILEDERNEK